MYFFRIKLAYEQFMLEELTKPGLMFLYCVKILYCQIISLGSGYNLFFPLKHLLDYLFFVCFFVPDASKDFYSSILISNLAKIGRQSWKVKEKWKIDLWSVWLPKLLFCLPQCIAEALMIAFRFLELPHPILLCLCICVYIVSQCDNG